MPTKLYSARDLQHPEDVARVLSNHTRSAMHTILGMLQLISDSPLSRSQQDFLKTCRMTADNLLRTVDDISGAAWHPDVAGEERVVLDLRAFFEKVESAFRLAAETNSRHFRWTMGPDVPAGVLVHETLLERFVIRLIGRSLEACGPALTVDITSNTGHVPYGQVAVVTVRLSCTEFEKGSSIEEVLDLAITRTMAGGLDAEVEIDDQGDGCWIVSRIPMQLAPVAPLEFPEGTVQEHGHSPGSGSPGHTRVLVADDCDDAYFLVETYLKSQNCTLVRARDGAEAVELAIHGGFGLILMDIDMPGCNGYEATRRIRSAETLRGSSRTPIVVLSGDSLHNQLHTGSQVGCSGYLSKPVTRSVLIQVLERYRENAESS